MSGRRRYLDDVFPKVVARQDETYRPVVQLNQAVNMGYERAKANASTPKQRAKISHAQENYNVRQQRQRQVTSRGYGHTRRERQHHKRQDADRVKRQKAVEQLSSDTPIVAQRPQAQLWDKDKVDLAKTQQAYYSTAAANIGVNWGNNLNPYSQGGLIDNAFRSFGTTNLVPYTLPATSILTPSLSAEAFMGAGVGGEVGGLVGSQVLPLVWDNKYAPIVGGIGGGILGGSVGAGIGKSIRNAPYRTLAKEFNKNIRLSSIDANVNNPAHMRWFDQSAFVKPVRPISVAEELGIPKGDRAMFDPQVVANAKKFADRYGYTMPETMEGIKDMYRRHNTFFRTVGIGNLKPFKGIQTQEQIDSWYPQFKGLSETEAKLKLASEGYPIFMKSGNPAHIGKGATDDFVFVSPSLESNKTYQGINGLTNTVKLQRPFSLRNPSIWHIDADWNPVATIYKGKHAKGTVSQGNAGLAHEAKISTEHLIPVSMAKPTDLGTLRLKDFKYPLFPEDFNNAVNGKFPTYYFKF